MLDNRFGCLEFHGNLSCLYDVGNHFLDPVLSYLIVLCNFVFSKELTLVLILVLKFSKIAAVLPNTGLSLQGHCQTLVDF